MIPAGALRHKVRIEQRSSTVSAANGKRSDVWTELATRRAKVKHLRASEGTPESGEIGKLYTEISIRYDSTVSTITQENRIILLPDGDIFDIESPINIGEENRVIVIQCINRSR